MTQKKTEAGKAVDEIDQTAIQEANSLAEKKKKPADDAKESHRKAVEEYESALDTEEKKQEEADQAAQAQAKAQADFDRCILQINPLQNKLTNLNQRKEKAVQAQNECSEQHDLCKTVNDSVQLLSDQEEAAIFSGYHAVQKYSKQTCFHERQVHETCQHMESARKLLKEARELFSFAAS